jgi:diphosphomevalonate decarboxylase
VNSPLLAHKNIHPSSFISTWMAPSNIAFIKYWGKKGKQLPANPSLSMTLNECCTTTTTRFTPANELSVKLWLEGEINEAFGGKIVRYLQSLISELPWLANLSIEIETSNTFPHGTGIASSASGMCAFALTLADFIRHFSKIDDAADFYKLASYLARLASGSACRSVYGGFVAWGESDLTLSSNEFATPFEVHPDIGTLCDSIIVISSEEKKVSSRSGHEKMQKHLFADARFGQAAENFKRIMPAMKAADMNEVGRILESEALALHAMMMTSADPFILIRPNTLMAIEKVITFRQESGLALYYTLDAGPNLHLIYPPKEKEKIHTFIHHELLSISEKVIHDETGKGPWKR